jgi:hypothetical protein
VKPSFFPKPLLSKGVKSTFLPKPLLYKEWKENRWWLLTAFVLLVFGPVSNLIGVMSAPQTGAFGDTTARLVWKTLVPILYHVQYSPGNAGAYPTFQSSFIHGHPAVSTFGGIVSMGLMIALITVERNRHTLWFTFSFPIRRIDALRVKIVFAASVAIFGLLVNFLILVFCNVAAHGVIPWTTLWYWLGENLLISLTLMSIGLLCGAIVQSGPLAGITALIMASYPWGLGFSIFRSLPTNVGIQEQTASMYPGATSSTFPLLVSGATTPSGRLSLLLRSLSPTSFFSGSGGFGGSVNGMVVSTNWGHPLTVGLVLWFVCVIILSGAAGIYAYLRTPIERNSYWVMFPQLGPWIRVLYDGALSLFLVNAFTATSQTVNNTPYLLTGYWFGMWLVVWLISIGIREAYKMRIRSQH